MILFYSFVALEVVWGISILISPLIVFPCFDEHATAAETLLAGSLYRQVNLFAVGLLIYAFYYSHASSPPPHYHLHHRHHHHHHHHHHYRRHNDIVLALWNVGLLLCIFALTTCLFFALMIPYDQLEHFVTCHAEHATLIKVKFGFLVWILAVFICAVNETSRVIVDDAIEEDENENDNNNNNNTTEAEAAETTTAATQKTDKTKPPLNPVYYMKQNWKLTHSIWGKISIILYYSWIWFHIVASIASVIHPFKGLPTSGACLPQHFSHSDTLMAATYIRELSIYAIGFWLYADRGGIFIGNIAYVTIVYVTWVFLHLYDFVAPLRNIVEFEPCVDDIATLMHPGIWFFMVGWLLLAGVTAVVDATRVPTTTTTSSETTPLNV